jgi:undecaprenyl-phosphate 4-deoxy-4-formamido-L-arabinose transferase
MNEIRKTDLTIVIPVYNSQQTIGKLVAEMKDELEDKYEYNFVLVNDGSIDDSYDICKKMALADKKIKFLNLYRNFGQINAILAGFYEADGDIIIVMDDDLQNPPREVHKLIAAIKNGYDFVYGSPRKIKQNIWRKFGSYLSVKMAEIAFKKPKGLYPSSYYGVRKNVVQEVIKYDGPFPYCSGLILRVTRNGLNVPVEHYKREYGQSGYNFKRLFLLWLGGITNFSILPLRISLYTGFIVGFSGFLFLFIILIQKLIKPVYYVMGWPSVIAVILLFSGVQLFVLGMLGEYIGRIFMSINKTPQFVIKEKYNCSNDQQNF